MDRVQWHRSGRGCGRKRVCTALLQQRGLHVSEISLCEVVRALQEPSKVLLVIEHARAVSCRSGHRGGRGKSPMPLYRRVGSPWCSVDVGRVSGSARGSCNWRRQVDCDIFLVHVGMCALVLFKRLLGGCDDLKVAR